MASKQSTDDESPEAVSSTAKDTAPPRPPDKVKRSKSIFEKIKRKKDKSTLGDDTENADATSQRRQSSRQSFSSIDTCSSGYMTSSYAVDEDSSTSRSTTRSEKVRNFFKRKTEVKSKKNRNGTEVVVEEQLEPLTERKEDKKVEKRREFTSKKAYVNRSNPFEDGYVELKEEIKQKEKKEKVIAINNNKNTDGFNPFESEKEREEKEEVISIKANISGFNPFEVEDDEETEVNQKVEFEVAKERAKEEDVGEQVKRESKEKEKKREESISSKYYTDGFNQVKGEEIEDETSKNGANKRNNKRKQVSELARKETKVKEQRKTERNEEREHIKVETRAKEKKQEVQKRRNILKKELSRETVQIPSNILGNITQPICDSEFVEELVQDEEVALFRKSANNVPLNKDHKLPLIATRGVGQMKTIYVEKPIDPIDEVSSQPKFFSGLLQNRRNKTNKNVLFPMDYDFRDQMISNLQKDGEENNAVDKVYGGEEQEKTISNKPVLTVLPNGKKTLIGRGFIPPSMESRLKYPIQYDERDSSGRLTEVKGFVDIDFTKEMDKALETAVDF